uniref:CUB domain-containing protein n=1 Tax=Panagrolaimus superbus TaxID=310955 RepID=A0A914Y0X6_9BILA
MLLLNYNNLEKQLKGLIKNNRFKNYKNTYRFDKNITDTEVYYFTSDAGSFTLYYNDTNDASVGTHFSALISDVNVPSSSTTEQCSSSSMADENKIMVYNLDYETGYKANQNCKYSIAMKEKQEISVSIEIFHIEKNVDTLFLIHGAKKYALTPDGMYSLQLTAAANNSLIVFNADSSVQQAGFEVALKTLDCSCPTQQIVVPCDLEIRFGPLNGGDVNYCDDMNCSYQVCDAEKIHFNT